MVDTLDRVHLQVEVKREVKRQEMREETSWVAEAKYLALDAFGLIRADCFWEGFEEFSNLAAERYLDLDFSSIKLNMPKVEGEQEEEVNQGDTTAGKGI